jgi:hypothetical protein
MPNSPATSSAMDKGYYAAEGLDLTYLPGGPDVIPEGTIVAGGPIWR